ncbi:hypothetical protein [uncultured Bacteroides sp.]|jgi:hypothetical protein|uniref:hypothetical protein n=1 Tax=uncultured Bacteroides sp. TaxID=162156 RepID=UPI00262389E4|nr:hypothetical protein [uncultured Bacteroides sp.]
MNNLKSKLQVRAFAVHEVMEKLGAGCTEDKIVDMASAIENYMLKDIDIPDTVDSEKTISEIVQLIGSCIAQKTPEDKQSEEKQEE